MYNIQGKFVQKQNIVEPFSEHIGSWAKKTKCKTRSSELNYENIKGDVNNHPLCPVGYELKPIFSGSERGVAKIFCATDDKVCTYREAEDEKEKDENNVKIHQDTFDTFDWAKAYPIPKKGVKWASWNDIHYAHHDYYKNSSYKHLHRYF